MNARRAQRLRKLLELVSTQTLHTQEEVAAALEAAGFQVTQSSVSRDITALRLVKDSGVYRRPGAALAGAPGLPGGAHQAGAPAGPDSDAAAELLTRSSAQVAALRPLTESVLSCASAGSVLVVLHTPPGEAGRAALALDRSAWPGIVGTIAGDDTIFIAVRDERAQRQVLAMLGTLCDLPEPDGRT